jgi:hypothetical protein
LQQRNRKEKVLGCIQLFAPFQTATFVWMILQLQPANATKLNIRKSSFPFPSVPPKRSLHIHEARTRTTYTALIQIQTIESAPSGPNPSAFKWHFALSFSLSESQPHARNHLNTHPAQAQPATEWNASLKGN